MDNITGTFFVGFAAIVVLFAAVVIVGNKAKKKHNDMVRRLKQEEHYRVENDLKIYKAVMKLNEKLKILVEREAKKENSTRMQNAPGFFQKQ